MNRLLSRTLAAIWMMIPVFQASAQVTPEERRRDYLESVEELRPTEEVSGGAIQIGPMPTRTRGWLVDWGATLSTVYTAGDNNDRQDSVADAEDHSWVYDGKVYALVQNVPRTRKFYFRGVSRYTETKKNSPAIRGSDYIQPKVELLYWEEILDQFDYRHRVRLGRQFVQVGRGMAFGLTADGITWEARRGLGTIRLIGLRQNPGDDNIDLLAPGSGRTQRLFYGMEIKCRVGRTQTYGVYGLANVDRNFDYIVNLQRHQFDSKYYGVTMDASPFSRLAVWGEFVLERGRTFGHLGTSKTIGIYATAYDLGMRVFLGNSDLAPTLYLEAAGASGDRDRLGNVYSSSGGSTDGRDSVFRGFGGLSLGLALAPSLANIHVFKAGGSVKPFARSSHRMLNDLTAQVSFYDYLVDDEVGPTSDPVFNISTAAGGANIGKEFDAQISWKPMGDLRYLLQAGVFLPGMGYGVNRDREDFMRFKMSVDL